VPCEITLLSCPVRTFVACVWFDARVRPHVVCQSTLSSCPVCTFVACVWFDARVRPHVDCESTLSSCHVCTFVACVWFDARVRPHVPREMTLPTRLVQAHGANVHRPPLLLLPGRSVSPLLLPGATRSTTCRPIALALSLPHCDPGPRPRRSRFRFVPYDLLPGRVLVLCVYSIYNPGSVFSYQLQYIRSRKKKV
jgi:hypothetical protein